MMRGKRLVLGGVTAAIVAASITMTTPGTANAWLHVGRSTAYPAEGGRWDYGFWNAKVRSYYDHKTLTHGSSVVYNGSLNRSICTAAGYQSSAEEWAINYPAASDAYYYRIC